MDTLSNDPLFMESELPVLVRDELAPAFTVCDRDQQPVSRAQFRDRRYLVLLFFAPADAPEALLQELSTRVDALRWWETEVLALLPVPPAKLPPSIAPIRYLADPELTATRSYTRTMGEWPLPTVVVLDRYGAFEERWVAPLLPTGDELLRVVERLAIRCSG